MAEGINVRFSGELQKFIRKKVADTGLYHSTSEYIRDLVRRDYEEEERRKWVDFRRDLQPGIEAKETEFVELNSKEILAEARKSRRGHAG